MTITTALRFKPYCLEKKVEALIPGTLLGAEIYPSFLRIFHVLTSETLFQKEFFEFGPLQKFTVFQDLENNRIEVTGCSRAGFVRYFIHPGKIWFQKGGSEQFTFPCEKLPEKKKAHLSLGCSKAQDATLILRRMNVEELVPIVYELSQSIGAIEPYPLDIETFMDFLSAGLRSLFYPAAIPYQGIQLPAPALSLLKGSELFIRELFFREHDGTWLFLPALLKEFHEGRLVSLMTQAGHQISIEWTKKSIRQVEILPVEDSHYQFKFSNDIQRFRLRAPTMSSQVLTNGAKIKLIKGLPLTLDRFER